MSTKHPFDVLCVGAANYDTIAVVPHLPTSDQRMTTDTLVDAGGGPAATAAVALARDGARVAFCGVVGDDEIGDRVRGMLGAEGVDTQWLRTVKDLRTTRTVVLIETETSTRALIAGVYPPPEAGDIPLDAAPWLHVDQIGFEPTMRALDGATRRPRVSVDAGNPIAGLTLERIDLYVPTVEALLRRYPDRGVEQALADAAAEGPATVVATDGARGTWLIEAGEVRHVPAFEVQVRSTLGAGDVFHGALLSGLVRSLTIDAAVRRASAVAGLSCRAIDGRTGIPFRDETDRFLDERSPSA